MPSHTPKNEKMLLQMANSLSGKTLQYLATKLRITLPQNLAKDKGLVGEMLEDYLGAQASTWSEPDFLSLGIELKSIPLNAYGYPKESTFVCHAPLRFDKPVSWQNSAVKKKLSKVLWIPIEADSNIPLCHRRIGDPVLWFPNKEVERQLKNDWHEIMELLCLGRVDRISSAMGEHLHLKPKGRNARTLTKTTNQAGYFIDSMTCGFYLRTHFTHTIFSNPR